CPLTDCAAVGAGWSRHCGVRLNRTPAIGVRLLDIYRSADGESADPDSERGGSMKRLLVLLIGVIVGLGLTVSPATASNGQKILTFHTMVAVSGPFVGSTNPIRGINGGGLPWQIDAGKGQLSTSGKLEVKVRGLVLLEAAPVPEALQGTNPVANFQAVVSCLTPTDGGVTTVNVATALSPASPSGDAKITAHLDLPSPCFAPIVFVGPSGTP